MLHSNVTLIESGDLDELSAIAGKIEAVSGLFNHVFANTGRSEDADIDSGFYVATLFLEETSNELAELYDKMRTGRTTIPNPKDMVKGGG